MEKFTLKQFQQMFPDDDSCLEYLRREWYPEIITCEGCGREAKFRDGNRALPAVSR